MEKNKPKTTTFEKIIIVFAFVVSFYWLAASDYSDEMEIQPANTTKVTPLMYNGQYVVGADHHRLMVVHNPDARDVTYDQMLRFVHDDRTDNMGYNDSFICGDAAETLQRNAANAGIRCGYVYIEFTEGEDHLANVFNTTDRGIVYIDCSGSDSIIPELVPGKLCYPVYTYSVRTLNGELKLLPIGVVSKSQIIW